MDLDWDIKEVEDNISFYIKTIGCTKQRATELAVDKHWKHFKNQPEIIELRERLRKHYNIK